MPFISQVAVGRRKCLSVFGNDYPTKDGTGVRDYIHIVDLAEGHVSAINSLLKTGATGFMTYNLGTGCGYSVLEVIEAFSKASSRTVKYEIAPRWAFRFIITYVSVILANITFSYTRRAGDIATSYADASLAEKVLGWKAKRGLKEMCEDTWMWQHKNPNGFAKL